IVRVAELYLQALAKYDLLAFAKAEQLAVEKLYELASVRLDMGLIPITDLYDAKARMATTQVKTIAAADLLDDAMQALEEVSGETVSDRNLLLMS
ncbi:MAG: TolC family protein, partial [Candidatus Marinimicrobia bacterium]|nr:TolC family protein [Candidatus Neomarinimicrobiota bacterium]